MREALRKLREDKGWSCQQVADSLGVSKAAVSGWELGKTSVSTANVYGLSKLYDVSVDRIMALIYSTVPQTNG